MVKNYISNKHCVFIQNKFSLDHLQIYKKRGLYYVSCELVISSSEFFLSLRKSLLCKIYDLRNDHFYNYYFIIYNYIRVIGEKMPAVTSKK